MRSGYSIVIGVMALGFGMASCASSLEPVPSPAHAAFLAWAQERKYTNFQPCERRSPGICWAPCQSSTREVWYRIGAYPGEWFSLVHVAPSGETWQVEEFIWRRGDTEGNGPPPEGIAACRDG